MDYFSLESFSSLPRPICTTAIGIVVGALSGMANSLKRTIGVTFRQRIRPHFAIEEAIEPSLGSNGAAMIEQQDAEGGVGYRLGGV